MEMRLRRAVRIWLWDYERSSSPYLVLCLLIIAFVLFVPAEWLGDPMVVRR